MSYETDFSVAYHECDSESEAQVATYFRYMQEAAFRASAALGYDEARYHELGFFWLAYATDFALYHPLRYGDSVTVRTWIANFRRVRSLRCYELRRQGKIIGQATTDWVLVSRETARPVKIPREMVEGYSQGKPLEPPPALDAMPAIAPTPAAQPSEREVVWSEIDGAGHVNNAVYLNYAVDADARLGLGKRTPRRCHVAYHAPALLHDRLTVLTWASGDLRHTRIQRSETLIASIERLF